MLGAIRAYWKLVPMAVRQRMSAHGTSERAYAEIANGAGVGTFLALALPLRKLGYFMGMPYDKGEW